MRALCIGALLCLSAQIALGQSTQGTGQRPVFRTSTRLVQVSVVVKDNRGQPVPGLTADDFEIFEDRKAQRVTHFAVRNEAAFKGPATVNASGPTFTNVLGGRVGTGATILLFDRLNTEFADQGQAIKHVVRFLQQLQPTDRIGFYVLESDGFRIVQDFSRDVATLLELLQTFRGKESAAYSMSTAPLPGGSSGSDLEHAMYEAVIRQSESGMHAHALNNRVLTTAEALEMIAQRLAGVQGRKNVVWLSSAFPLRFSDGVLPRNMSPEIYRATRTLSHSDVAIYPVDARGLVGAFSGSSQRKEKQFTTLSSVAREFETAAIVAEQTGGRPFRNTNDLATAMRTAAEDAALTYELGYYPSDEKWDVRFRRISVKVARPGVTVRHRSGYFAHAPAVADPTLQETALFRALKRPLESTAVGLQVDVARGEQADHVSLTIRVDARGIVLQQKGTQWQAALELIVAHNTPDGQLLGSVHTTIPLELSEEARQQFFRDGFTVTKTVRLAVNAQQLIVGVRDTVSGAVGTVRIDAARLRALSKSASVSPATSSRLTCE